MRSIPISIDHIEVEEWGPNDGHQSRLLTDDEMIEIMRGCLEGIRRLGPVRECIGAVKVIPSVTRSGCWPPAPLLPIDYEIRVNLGEPANRHAPVLDQFKANDFLGSHTESEEP